MLDFMKVWKKRVWREEREHEDYVIRLNGLYPQRQSLDSYLFNTIAIHTYNEANIGYL